MVLLGTFIPDPNDVYEYNNIIIGFSWITFDSTTGTNGSPTPRIFVGVANKGESNIFVSENAGATCEFAWLPDVGGIA